jgi:hypothetical protein
VPGSTATAIIAIFLFPLGFEMYLWFLSGEAKGNSYHHITFHKKGKARGG